MIKEWLNWLNGGIAIAAFLLLLIALIVALTTTSPSSPQQGSAVKTLPPSSAFNLPQEAYDAIGESALSLNSAPITLQLPDLRKQLVYHGKNNRPDADLNSTMMHFGFVGSKIINPLKPNTPIYLIYDKKQSPPRYDFSPENQESALWIQVAPEGTNASIQVRMKNDKGEIIATPQSYASFSLTEKPFIRMENASWEIGKQRVDGTLLARQRARWFGADIFFLDMAVKNTNTSSKKQRVDFEDSAKPYSIFIQQGDVLVWNNNRWTVTLPGNESVGKPLLFVKKIDDRIINFELWDAEGKSKIGLNLLKSNEPAPINNLMQAFKFVGSRTRSKFVFEANKERITLSPGDWLLQVNNKWKKLSTPDEIDSYVDRKVTGLLFVFENVERRDDRQILVGTLFNKSRTDIQPVEMIMDSGSNLSPAPPGGILSPKPTKKEEDEEEEDDDDEDEEIIFSKEKSASLELHPHSREDIHHYQKSLR